MFRQQNTTELRLLSDKSYCLALSYFNKKEWGRSISFFKESIDYLLGIYVKTENDHQKLVRIYFQLGNSYFNHAQYDNALYAYDYAIKYYGAILPILVDDDYRQQIKIFINICDSYLAINKVDMAHQSLLRAMETFDMIHNKTARELELTHIDHHPKLFYDHYEKTTSSKYFLNSLPHIKQAGKLEDYYHQNRLDNMIDDISNININTPIAVKIKTDQVDEITTQLGQLSFIANINNSNILNNSNISNNNFNNNISINHSF